jgi:hypothetical protein
MTATSGESAPPPVMAAPRSSSALQQLEPASTLRIDRFDAPAPVSVSEAEKAEAGGDHEGHDMRAMPPGADRENPPAPMPATRDGTHPAPGTDHDAHRSHGSGSASEQAAVVYTCPMHPEVTSDRPGTCPKCGMALVKKRE